MIAVDALTIILIKQHLQKMCIKKKDHYQLFRSPLILNSANFLFASLLHKSQILLEPSGSYLFTENINIKRNLELHQPLKHIKLNCSTAIFNP